MTTVVKLHGPDDATIDQLEELGVNLLRLSEAVEQPVNLIDLIGHIRDRGIAGDFKCFTAGDTNDLRISFIFSQRLLNLMTAMRGMEWGS